jgi:hypothetical protein
MLRDHAVPYIVAVAALEVPMALQSLRCGTKHGRDGVCDVASETGRMLTACGCSIKRLPSTLQLKSTLCSQCRRLQAPAENRTQAQDTRDKEQEQKMKRDGAHDKA